MPDQRERMGDREEATQAALDGRQFEIQTALPGIVESWSAAEGTVSVQIAVREKVRQADGTLADETLPLLIHCPVQWPGGAGFCLTFPLAKGDEGLVVFASRCIDGWWEAGGVQGQPEFRMHDLSDGFFLPGTRSKARAVSAVSEDSLQLRTNDGAVFVEVTDSGVFIKGDLQVEGKVDATMEISAMTAVPANKVTVSQHVHTSASPGSPTSTPTPGT